LTPYFIAQQAIANLRGAIYQLLLDHPRGMTNAQISRALGIHLGYKRPNEDIGHQGCISRSVLQLMEDEGVVAQNIDSKVWTINVI
jgi:hypothetical protein